MCSGCSGDYCGDFPEVCDFSRESVGEAETIADSSSVYPTQLGNVGWWTRETRELRNRPELPRSCRALGTLEDYEVLVGSEYIREVRIVRVRQSSDWCSEDKTTRGA